MLFLGQVHIEPVSNFIVNDASVVSDPRQFKDDNAVVVIQNPNSQQDVDDLAWQKWCLNNPDGLQGFAKVDCCAQRVEKAEIRAPARR